MIGQLIGNYKIEEKLGEGGMGSVYKGVDTMLDREVAIKALKPELASQTSIVERFRSEAVTLAKLNHPNIAALYALFRQGAELYMVLEYVRGDTLDTILQKRGALSSDEAIPVFCQVLDGIDHAHQLGIIHRDIKPANIMLTERGKLKVLDFGIARLLGSARMTRAGNIIGTLEYMAPEQVKGQETDARSDIYALGMMLYEVLTGKTPFDTENEFELMKLQTEATPRAPREINPAIPEAVEAAIMQAIEKNPENRFQTAGDFRETLMDAGFAAHGSMRQTTGSRRAQSNTRPSKPDAAQIETAESTAKEFSSSENISSAAPSSNYEPKETRLGESAAPEFAAVETIKETRLGAADFTNSEVAVFGEPSKSFLNNLTAMHYAGASFAAVVLLGLLIIVPYFILRGGSGSGADKVSEEIKPAVAPSIVETKKEEEKPEVITPIESTPTDTRQTAAADNKAPTPFEPLSDPKSPPPRQQQPPEAKPPGKSERAKPEQPAPRRDTPVTSNTNVARKQPPKAAPVLLSNKSDMTRTAREERLRKLLTAP